MTNREYLNTLSDEEFASVVLAKVSELQEKNCDDELDIFDIAVGEQFDFEQWLKEEYKPDSTSDPKGADGSILLNDFFKKTERK